VPFNETVSSFAVVTHLLVQELFLYTYNVSALLLYNDGSSSSNMQPINVTVGGNNQIGILFLSYTLGQTLADAVNDPTKIVTIRLTIETNIQIYPIGNIVLIHQQVIPLKRF